MNKLLRFHKTIFILIVITLLSLLKVGDLAPDQVKLIPYSDKIVHFIMYFTATFILLFEYYLHHNKNKSGLINLIFIPFIWGALMEVCQFFFTDNRAAEWWDFIANTLGLVIGYVSFRLMCKNSFIQRLVLFPFGDTDQL